MSWFNSQSPEEIKEIMNRPKNRPRDRGRSKIAYDYAYKTCRDCGDIYQPTSGTQVMCRPCFQAMRLEAYIRYTVKDLAHNDFF